jgi:ribosomal protein S18 acetylase RimI-like enzyme
MPISIREIAENDVAAIVSLMREFAEYENLSEYCTVTEERLYATMFGASAFVDGLIFFDDDAAIAYALFYPSFSSFRGERGLFLEDIYISEEYRRHNLGEKMLREIAHIAKERGCERIDFHVLDWNTPAVNFYLKHGAEKIDDERHYKFAGEAFEKLAS